RPAVLVERRTVGRPIDASSQSADNRHPSKCQLSTDAARLDAAVCRGMPSSDDGHGQAILGQKLSAYEEDRGRIGNFAERNWKVEIQWAENRDAVCAAFGKNCVELIAGGGSQNGPTRLPADAGHGHQVGCG